MAGLEGEGQAVQISPATVEVVRVDCPVGEQETVLIECGASGQPARGRLGTDEREHGNAPKYLLAVPARQRHRFERPASIHGGDLAGGSDVDATIGLDPLDEITRHALVEVVAADHEGDGAARLGE